MSPFFGFSLFAALSRASIARFPLMRGDACHPTISRESGLRRVARQGHPSLVGMRAMSPHHTLLLFLMENPLFKTLAPLSEAFPPLLCFLGGLQDTSLFLAIMRCTVLPFATMPILRSSTTIRPGESAPAVNGIGVDSDSYSPCRNDRARHVGGHHGRMQAGLRAARAYAREALLDQVANRVGFFLVGR